MADEGEIQRINITLGKSLNAHGERMDVVTIKGYPETFVSNILFHSAAAWHWRLVPEDMLEQQKAIVAKRMALSLNKSRGSRHGS